MFCIYGITRSFFTDFISFSLLEEGAVFYFRYIFFSLAIAYFLIKKEVLFVSLFTKFTLITILFLFIDGFVQFFFTKNIFGYEYWAPYRINSVFSFIGEPVLGRYISYISLIIIFFLTAYKFIKFQNIILLVLIPVSLLIILISGERVPFFRFVVILILFLIFSNKEKKNIFFSSLLICLFAFIGVVFSSNSVKDRIVNQTISNIQSTSFSIVPFNASYEKIYSTAIETGKENIIFGNGPNSFENLCLLVEIKDKKQVGCSHPHNFWVQIFSEQGLVGLGFILIFYLYLIFKFIRFLHQRHFTKNSDSEINDIFKKAIPTFMLLIYLFPFIPNMSIYNNWNNIFIFFVFGLLLRYSFFGNLKNI